MLLYAEKRGRFIPCRGGGTATTYYTDGFDVDEDVVSILCHGECWPVGNWAGVTTRHLFDAKDRAVDTVASRLIYLS